KNDGGTGALACPAGSSRARAWPELAEGTPGAIVFFVLDVLLLRLEVEGRRVHAVAQPGRPRTIRKHVPQMRIAAGTARLRSSHTITGVGDFLDVLAIGGGIETRPPGSRIKFRFRAKKQRATADAVVRAVVVLVPVLAGESGLGAAGAGHLILLRSELLPPLAFGLGDLVAQLVNHVGSPENKM